MHFNKNRWFSVIHVEEDLIRQLHNNIYLSVKIKLKWIKIGMPHKLRQLQSQIFQNHCLVRIQVLENNEISKFYSTFIKYLFNK
jgi:hypothetical protein